MRYLNQRYAMPYKECKAILTDIGTEELAHQEMIAAIVYQLTRNLTPEQIKEGGFDAYFVDHTTGIYPQSAAGVPFTAAALQSKGDPITDLFEDLAAEQKARTTYDNLLRLIDNPDVREPLKFLRAREVVHFQRFGDANLTKLSAFFPSAKRGIAGWASCRRFVRRRTHQTARKGTQQQTAKACLPWRFAICSK